jgi:hypothetical protein
MHTKCVPRREKRECDLWQLEWGAIEWDRDLEGCWLSRLRIRLEDYDCEPPAKLAIKFERHRNIS